MSVNIVYDTSGGHSYRNDAGADVPGVTRVLKPLSDACYRDVPREVLDRAAQLGRAVHLMIHYDCKGTLDVDSLEGDVRKYYNIWRNFRSTSSFEPILSEHVVHSARFGYAGQIDLYGVLNGELVHIDAKRCANIMPTVGPQTAAYGQALTEMGHEWKRRFALHMHGNTANGWSLHEYSSPHDLRLFLSALNVHNFIKERTL